MTASTIESLIRQIVREEVAALQQQPEPRDQLLTTKQAAARAGVGRTTLRRWIDADGLPAREVPGRVAGKAVTRILASDLDSWMRARPMSGAKVSRLQDVLDAKLAQRRRASR